MGTRTRLLISGRVQGVWFRASAREEAERLGVSGWVRNRRSGEVEVLAEGDQTAVEALVAWCRRGSRGAIVANVERVDEAYRGELAGFVIEETV